MVIETAGEAVDDGVVVATEPLGPGDARLDVGETERETLLVGAGELVWPAAEPDNGFPPIPGINASANTPTPITPRHARAHFGKAGITTFTKSPEPRIATARKAKPPMANTTCRLMVLPH
jgi:hypothetical protein